MIQKRSFVSRLIRFPGVVASHYQLLRKHNGYVCSLYTAIRLGVLIL